jgi:hypothetical protein
VELVPEDKIFVPRIAKCEEIHCRYHKKEARYALKYYPNDALFIAFCLECKPHAELLRFKIAVKDPAKGDGHLIPKIVTPTVTRVDGDN